MNMTSKATWHYWVISIVSLLWNAMGAVDYTMTQTQNKEYLSQMTPEQMEYITNFPAWSEAFWALGVWGSLLGSVLLLLRKKWAVGAFAVSLLGLLGTTIYQFGVADMPDSIKTSGNVAFTATIWIVVLFLFWYSRKKRDEGVLG
jgi:hypothetical protein